jgi:hypothetical protein
MQNFQHKSITELLKIYLKRLFGALKCAQLELESVTSIRIKYLISRSFWSTT